MMRTRSLAAPIIFALISTLLLGACGGSPPLELGPDATRGRLIANANGCASCHGKNGQGVTAPSWQGLYDTDVELSDGRIVTADDDYLRRSITDPQAEVVHGWTIKMPNNAMTDDQIELIVAYIRELK